MRFVPPPSWPIPPQGWTPDPGWEPNPAWGPAPDQWRFWVNDDGVPIEAPRGFYGATKRSRRVPLALAAMCLFGLGAIVGNTNDDPDDPATVARLPVSQR